VDPGVWLGVMIGARGDIDKTETAGPRLGNQKHGPEVGTYK